MSRSLACLAVLLALASAAPAAAGPRHLQTLFVVTVDQGPSAGLVLQGVLSADVDPATGVLAGTLTPGPDPRTGLPYPSVSFTTVDGHFLPNLDVTALPVRGELQHHAVHLILLDAGGPGKPVFGVGTTEADTGTGLRHAPGALGGPASGPEPGDLGDWEIPCCNIR